MKRRLGIIFNEKINVANGKWSVNLFESCYEIDLEAEIFTGAEGAQNTKVSLKCRPSGSDGYELLIDYQLQAGDVKEFVECDKWNSARNLLELTCSHVEFEIILAVNVREILAAQDLGASTSFRNFHILTSESEFYINTAQLNALGGKLFKEWYDREAQGEDSAVIQTMDADELRTLLHAACAYSTSVIHRQNFEKVLEIARRWRINGLLRCVESFLVESTVIHRIRKLEYSVEYRMARLADVVLRSFGSKTERIECLFDYLAQNQETLDDVHPDVLEMCEIFHNYVVL